MTGLRRSPWRRAAASLAPLALVALTGCSGVQSALVAAGDQSSTIRGVWDLMLWICGTMYVVVLVAGSAR